MDHHLAETRAAMIKEVYDRGYSNGAIDILAYVRRSDERLREELEKRNPFKWLGDFLKKKFGKGNSPETVIPDHQGNKQ